MGASDFAALLRACIGESWAVVYAYEAPKRPTGLWYDRWRYDVINDYVAAISLLGVEPYLIDVDAFTHRARELTSTVQSVVNLNSGATPISNLGLVPCVAEWNRIPCFPNSADVILTGERKDICRSVFGEWFSVPDALSGDEVGAGGVPGIIKPVTMGNSQGVTRDFEVVPDGSLLETFISGYDLTVPVFFDSCRQEYVVCPGVFYIPDVADPEEWFLSYEQKMDRDVIIERRLVDLAPRLRQALLSASKAFGFQTIARYDFRCTSGPCEGQVVDLDDVWFLEINCLPTLRTDVNFLKSLRSHLAGSDIEELLPKAAPNDIQALCFLLVQARGSSLRTK
jgi:hypothetical protein